MYFRTYQQKSHSGDYLVAEQRRLGLHLSIAVRAGLSDTQGDSFANSGEHTSRHHAAMYAWRDVEAEVAPGPVYLGDKKKMTAPAIVRHGEFNSGCTADIIVPCGADNDRHILIEMKCITPLCKSTTNGTGTTTNGGTPDMVGHTHGFGGTEEKQRADILGCAERGTPGQAPLNHKTGEGWVQAKVGTYDDGINKGSLVIPIVMGPSGGVCPHGWSHLKRLAREAGKAHAQDPGAESRSFLQRHSQRISAAVVHADAAHIRARIKCVLAAQHKSASSPSDPVASHA